MSVFGNRQAVEANLNNFMNTFFRTYQRLCNEKCPTLYRKLPFLKQGIYCAIAYGTDAFLILSRDSKLPPVAFTIASWDETEYPQLSTASDADTIAEILELEEILYSKKLDSLEPKDLGESLGLKAAEELAQALLEEHMHKVQPTLEDAVDRMKQAYELLFRLENSLRRLVEQELKKQFGEAEWWEKGATRTAKREFLKNHNDPRWKWHETMNVSPLNYIDFANLHGIIVEKNWRIFENIFGPQHTFTANIKNLEVPRNLIAHSNILSHQEFYDFRRTTERLLKIIEKYL